MSVILGSVFNIVIGLLLPLGVFLYILIHKRVLMRPFLCGLLTFVVFQFGVHLPLSRLVLDSQLWYITFKMANPILNTLLRIFLAALIAVGGQLLVMRLLMKKNHTWNDGVAFGFAHEGMVALIMGAQNFRLLLFNKEWLSMQPTADIFAAGIERIFAWMSSIFLTLLVLQCIRRKQPLYAIAAIVLMVTLNFSLNYLLTIGASLFTVLLILALVSVLLLGFTMHMKNHEKRSVS